MGGYGAEVAKVGIGEKRNPVGKYTKFTHRVFTQSYKM
jgi:hypothetical protein